MSIVETETITYQILVKYLSCEIPKIALKLKVFVRVSVAMEGGSEKSDKRSELAANDFRFRQMSDYYSVLDC